ncbi:sensor histidine kinase KdpD [Desulfosporosinus sp. BICA1-9]|uniref:sensor histidine kinase n=1 Tax=Desulfosporosinus sp. BICA1-9 TaxID=1531958 RepID=UPI00054B08C2|nr:sensor histidine kinase KdpD [Desulfosporosinus sp. BICA1-9]KJS50230.1 MAG: histidine kinase [Peptococcaceae bacterium BRH_c23]KJS90150.1 MAG: histidine kinase [Desulfosporosinus sp. BICA1-9]HBW38921.1 sensor histidine kinase KdpD [Desulfosporosinus sp.]
MVKGKLTIFLGAASGVGKTYAMLESALGRLSEGVDVVVGLVETHGRADTEAMLNGFTVIPRRSQEYMDRIFFEMDLDAVLTRRPQLVLIDELAHTNVDGSRHKKRYMDVKELLSAGINVYTTLNIQDLETLNDIVTQITGVAVRETVPDQVLEIASQIQLIDIPPEELIQRLKDGKVYVSDQETEGLKDFFRPGNINALRELALLYTAQRVDRQLESYRQDHGINGPWPTGEKILVCISASPFSAQLIRIAKRMTEKVQGQLFAVHVETLRRLPSSEAEKDSMAKNLRLAEELGAEVIGLTGNGVAEAILELARKRNVSQIIIGKPAHTRFWELIHGSVVDKVIRQSQGISIHVIPGRPPEAGKAQIKAVKNGEEAGTKPQGWNSPKIIPYLASSLMIIGMTLVFTLVHPFLGLVNISLLYLLPILISAALWGTLPAIVTAIMGTIAFDLFFVPPFFKFTVADLRYLISFAIFMLVGLITGTLSDRLKKQVNYSRQRENNISALYSLSRDIAAVDNLDAVLDCIVSNVSKTLEGQVMLLLPNEKAQLVLRKDSGLINSLDKCELSVATWVYERGLKAGHGTETLGTAKAQYLPLSTEQGTQGVLGININESNTQFDPERIRLLEAFTGLAAMAINRVKLAEQARESLSLVESERLRTALFNSLSHDLRTPLASIIGAVTGLLEDKNVIYSPEVRKELLKTILYGAERMNRFISNLLDMARLESGMLRLNKEWCDLQDIIGVAINRLGDTLTRRPLDIDIQEGLPLVQADGILIEQVLINLLDNALKYSEAASKIMISIRQQGNQLEIVVANRGHGIPEADLSKVFDKFYRLSSPLQVSGTGLGLAICKGLIEAHGGDIWAENNKLGGVTITFTLPLTDQFLGIVPEMNEGE